MWSELNVLVNNEIKGGDEISEFVLGTGSYHKYVVDISRITHRLRGVFRKKACFQLCHKYVSIMRSHFSTHGFNDLQKLIVLELKIVLLSDEYYQY